MRVGGLVLGVIMCVVYVCLCVCSMLYDVYVCAWLVCVWCGICVFCVCVYMCVCVCVFSKTKLTFSLLQRSVLLANTLT